MKRPVWLSPCPGVGLRGIEIGRFLIWHKVLYRDTNGRCYVSRFEIESCLSDRDMTSRPVCLSPCPPLPVWVVDGDNRKFIEL